MTRSQRLDALREALHTQEHLAQIRLLNAEQGLNKALNATAPHSAKTLEAFQTERDLARHALAKIRERQGLCLTAQDRHTGDFPNGTLMIVLDGRTGEQCVIERRDDEDPPEIGDWYRIDAPDDPMTFEVAIGVDEGYSGHEIFRLYTAEQVDDLLDRAGVDDLFV